MEKVKKSFEIYHGGAKVSYVESEEIKQQIFDRIIKFCKEHDCVSGEKLHQSDDCIIEAPVVLSDVIDKIIKFKTKWKE